MAKENPARDRPYTIEEVYPDFVNLLTDPDPDSMEVAEDFLLETGQCLTDLSYLDWGRRHRRYRRGYRHLLPNHVWVSAFRVDKKMWVEYSIWRSDMWHLHSAVSRTTWGAVAPRSFERYHRPRPGNARYHAHLSLLFGSMRRNDNHWAETSDGGMGVLLGHRPIVPDGFTSFEQARQWLVAAAWNATKILKQTRADGGGVRTVLEKLRLPYRSLHPELLCSVHPEPPDTESSLALTYAEHVRLMSPSERRRSGQE